MKGGRGFTPPHGGADSRAREIMGPLSGGISTTRGAIFLAPPLRVRFRTARQVVPEPPREFPLGGREFPGFHGGFRGPFWGFPFQGPAPNFGPLEGNPMAPLGELRALFSNPADVQMGARISPSEFPGEWGIRNLVEFAPWWPKGSPSCPAPWVNANAIPLGPHWNLFWAGNSPPQPRQIGQEPFTCPAPRQRKAPEGEPTLGLFGVGRPINGIPPWTTREFLVKPQGPNRLG